MLHNQHENKKEERLPLGVRLLGAINFYILGIVALIGSAFTYFTLTEEDLPQIRTFLSRAGVDVKLSYEEVKISSFISALVAIVYILSGWGLLRRKEWARRLTVYFAFAWVLLYFLTFLISPQTISQALIQIVYPGILIFYFTSRKIETRFQQ